MVRVINHSAPENGSFMGRIGTMVVFRFILNVRSSSSQIPRIEMMHTGSETKNHAPQDGAGDIFSSAMMFCGDAIGDAIPPIFEASAIPKISAFGNSESALVRDDADGMIRGHRR